MWRPSTSDDHWSSAAPSSRTLPRTGCQTPTSARISDDLPEPLGPITPRPLPASSAKVTSCTMRRWSPGGTMATPSTERRLVGACNWVGIVCAGICSSRRVRRCQLWRAATKAFQCAIASSTGASARAERIEPAMMMPAVASWWMTR